MRATGRKIKIYAAVVLTLCAIFVLKIGAQQQAKDYVNRQAPMVHMAGLLRLVETIPLPSEGYMDHLSYDLKNQHLFLSGEMNKEVVVIDMKAAKVIQETKVGGNPRKPFFDSVSNELWVDLGDNTAVALNGSTFEVTKTVELTGGKDAPTRDPDNAAYDPARGLYYIGVRTRYAVETLAWRVHVQRREIIEDEPGRSCGSIARRAAGAPCCTYRISAATICKNSSARSRRRWTSGSVSKEQEHGGREPIPFGTRCGQSIARRAVAAI